MGTNTHVMRLITLYKSYERRKKKKKGALF